jgi:UTP--glucose-1-phosphate uridylyltransferase
VDGLTASVEKMRSEGVADAAVETFRRYYEQLREGDVGALPEADLEPIEDLTDAEQLPPDEGGASEALDRAVVLKLNGGLGTSMGLQAPKSLLQVKEGLSFLDIIVRQVLGLRRRSGARVPLLLMNSFATRDETLAALQRHPAIAADVPLDFVQNKVPKLRADDLQPVSWPDDPELAWAPPGHGDLYTAMVASGMLETLLDRGYRYAFVSNSDNLGAVLEPRILAWFAREEIPFLMEAADRTEADRKGGHLAGLRGGGLVLRESAQTREEDTDAFQDVRRHRFFNTNTLWVDLRALADALERRDGFLGLPMMANRKTVDPSDPSSPEVIQVETAMGAAIGVFDGARAVRVPRRRFAPVKTTNDLLAVRSDAYALTDEAHVELMPERHDLPPVVDLDSRFYKLLGDFEARFPTGPLSLVACDRLTVVGDVVFGRDVAVRGSVTIEHAAEEQQRIADGSVLEG